jgi:hypothetical protein
MANGFHPSKLGRKWTQEDLPDKLSVCCMLKALVLAYNIRIVYQDILTSRGPGSPSSQVGNDVLCLNGRHFVMDHFLQDQG